MNNLFVVLFFLTISSILASRYEYNNGEFKYSLNSLPDGKSGVTVNMIMLFKQHMDKINKNIENNLKNIVKEGCDNHKEFQYNNAKGSFSITNDGQTGEVNVEMTRNNNHHNIKLHVTGGDIDSDFDLDINQNYYFDLCDMFRSRDYNSIKTNWALYDDDENKLVKFEYDNSIRFFPHRNMQTKTTTIMDNDVKFSLTHSPIISADYVVKIMSSQ